MYLTDTNSMVLQAKYGDDQYNTLNINDLEGYCATNNPFNLLRLSSKYLQINISDAFAKCLNVLLNLPKACVHARTHGKMVSLANKLCGMY